MGGYVGRVVSRPTCNTVTQRRATSDLEWSPADPDHRIETRIRYDPDGAVHSEAYFDDQLNEVLNLNLAVLRNNRAGVLGRCSRLVEA